ncbi:unnamed protein product [Darwinula stevensoni]|uniref:Peptidase S1 domain-containing protein n=1 Tax=Darwinula stevensoni TaxID=69355 RepID=A0A7R8X1V5_9CRUS|nr:unnamed protein product [Darwinula stevensoni]CAG0882583.1 unnamed protein product [Darwinula stevensoni]
MWATSVDPRDKFSVAPGLLARIARVESNMVPTLVQLAGSSCGSVSTRRSWWFQNLWRDATGLIVGGQPATKGEFPFIVAIKEGQDFKCGGVIISNRYVLTAAHCYSSTSKLEDFAVTVGEYDMSTTSEGTDQKTFGLQSVKNHESWVATKPENGYDISLFKLNGDITFGKYIQPICIPSSDSESTLRASTKTVYGWGYRSNSDSTPATILQKLNVNLTSESICKSSGKINGPNGSMLCSVGDGVGGICSGDSGGPLATKDDKGFFYSFGIVSYNTQIDCGIEGYPDVYTRVSYFLNWIQANAV